MMKKSILVSEVLLFILAFYALWTFYIPLLNNYFISDDYQCIWFGATKSIYQIFFSPENYRALSGSNFTPMVGVSFKIDWLLFGIHPTGYFIHNLIALLMTGLALFLLMRLYTNNLSAFIGIILFLFNPVVLSVYGWCSTRHYMTGMFFALLSLYFHVKADRDDKTSIPPENPSTSPLLKVGTTRNRGGKGGLLILSGVFYLLSSLYKEVYVLLPAIAFFISRGSILQRMKKTLPMWIGLIIYSIWRFYMLGGIGGYPTGDALGIKSLTAGIYRIVEITSSHLFGPFHILFWIIILIMFITMNKKRRIFGIGIILIILLMPILPVTSLLNWQFSWARYVLHISVFLIFVSILWGSEILEQRGWKSIAVVPILIIVIALFVNRDNELEAVIYKEGIISRKTADEFLYSGKEYMKSEQDTWFYDGLRDINEYFYGRKINIKIIPEKERINYISEERRLEILSQGYDLGAYRGKELRKNTIKGKISIDGYRIQWELGPYKTGNYLVIRGRYSGLYNYITSVNNSGKYLFGRYYPDGRPEVFYLKVVYQSPEGWEGITDEYRIEIPGNSMINLESSH